MVLQVKRAEFKCSSLIQTSSSFWDSKVARNESQFICIISRPNTQTRNTIKSDPHFPPQIPNPSAKASLTYRRNGSNPVPHGSRRPHSSCTSHVAVPLIHQRGWQHSQPMKEFIALINSMMCLSCEKVLVWEKAEGWEWGTLYTF